MISQKEEQAKENCEKYLSHKREGYRVLSQLEKSRLFEKK